MWSDPRWRKEEGNWSDVMGICRGANKCGEEEGRNDRSVRDNKLATSVHMQD